MSEETALVIKDGLKIKEKALVIVVAKTVYKLSEYQENQFELINNDLTILKNLATRGTNYHSFVKQSLFAECAVVGAVISVINCLACIALNVPESETTLLLMLSPLALPVVAYLSSFSKTIFKFYFNKGYFGLTENSRAKAKIDFLQKYFEQPQVACNNRPDPVNLTPVSKPKRKQF